MKWTAFIPLAVALGLISLWPQTAILLWALIRFGQDHAARMDKVCNARLTEQGFAGNSDFYGLGIRIGIYLQWMSSILSDFLFPSTGRALAGAQASLSIAMSVAVLLLIFERDCTFTAEMMVIFHLMIGGLYISNVGYLEADPEPSWYNIRGLELTTLPIRLIALPTSAWFWVRTASAGEVDFARIPGGTSAFLLARVHGNSFNRAAAFFAFFSIWRLTGSLAVDPIAPRNRSTDGFVFRLLSWRAIVFGIMILVASILETLHQGTPLPYTLLKRTSARSGGPARYEHL